MIVVLLITLMGACVLIRNMSRELRKRQDHILRLENKVWLMERFKEP